MCVCVQGMKIGVIDETMRTQADGGCTSAPVLEAVQRAVQKLQDLGASVQSVRILILFIIILFV